MARVSAVCPSVVSVVELDVFAARAFAVVFSFVVAVVVVARFVVVRFFFFFLLLVMFYFALVLLY